MSLLILKLEDNILAQVVQDNKSKDFITDSTLKYGPIDLSMSFIIDGDIHILERLYNSIEMDYYSTSGLIKDEWFSDIITDIEKKNKRMHLDLEIYEGINISTEVVEEEIHEPIETFSLETESYVFFCGVFTNELVIGTDTSFNLSNLIGDGSLDKLKSFTVEFENFDEVSSMFEGIKYDTMEIYEESSIGITIPKEWKDKVLRLLENKITLTEWRDFKNFKNMNGHKKVEATVNEINNDMLTSKEVCKLLRISDQTLANWRRSGLIEFKKISSRKFIFPVAQVMNIQENGIDTDGLVVPESKKIPKVPVEVSAKIEKIKEIDYKKEITQWVKMFSFQVTELKYKKQNFFLNFGNVGFNSSPHVMITDDFKLFDYIKNIEIYSNEKDLWKYLDGLSKSGDKPRIDTSKRIYPGYANLYLNGLYEPAIRSN